MKKLVFNAICLLLTQMAFTQTYTVTPAKAYDYVDGIGINTHLRFTNVYNTGFDAIIYPKLKKLGIKHIRDAIPYKSFLNPADTLKIKNRFLKLYDSLGIKVCYLVDSRKVADSTNLRDAADYLSLFQTTPQLRATIQYLEGFNEPDLSIYSWYPANWDTLTYAIQVGLWNRAHSMPELSGIDILGPSLVTYWYIPSRARQIGARVPFLSTYFNYANLHTYDAGSSNSKLFPASYYDLTMQSVGFDTIRHNKPWVVTENGYENAINWNRPTDPGYNINSYHYISELAAGKYYSVMYMEMFKRGAKKVYSYELIDQNTADQANCENNFGLLHTDGTEKPAFTVIKNTISILNDPQTAFTPTPLTYTLSGDITGIRNSLYQKNDGQYYLALWQGITKGVCYDFPNFADIPSDSQHINIVLPFVSSQVNIYQPLISESPVYTYSNKDTIPVHVPDHLLLVEISPVVGSKMSTAHVKKKPEVRMDAFSRQNQNSVHVTIYAPEQEKGIIEIYNMAGALVATQAVTISGNRSEHDVNCRLAAGIYIAVFKSYKGIVFKKFIK